MDNLTAVPGHVGRQPSPTFSSPVTLSSFLVTGCAGFIGARVAKLLLDRGDHVVGVDNLNDYYDVSLKFHRLTELRANEHFYFHGVDISNRIQVAQVFEQHRFDAVINLAARAGVRYSMENPYVYMQTNAMGNLHLLEELRTHAIGKYVLASTSSLYAGQSMPFSETLPVNTPISPYAASKKAAEAMAYSYHHLHDIDVSVLRFFTVYGPAGRPDMSYFRFIDRIHRGLPITVYGDGTQSRDFTHVDDVAAGTIAATKPVGYEVINLGGGNEPHSINELVGMIEDHLGKKATIVSRPFHIADMDATWADIDKADRLLDWRPRVSFADGVKACVNWYLDNLAWIQDLPTLRKSNPDRASSEASN